MKNLIFVFALGFGQSLIADDCSFMVGEYKRLTQSEHRVNLQVSFSSSENLISLHYRSLAYPFMDRLESWTVDGINHRHHQVPYFANCSNGIFKVSETYYGQTIIREFRLSAQLLTEILTIVDNPTTQTHLYQKL